MKPYRIDGKVTSRLYHNDEGIRWSPACNPGQVLKIKWDALKELPKLAEMFNAIFEHYEGISSAKTFSDVKVWIDNKPSDLHRWVEILAAHGALEEVGPPDEVDERVTLSQWKDDSELESLCTSILTYQGD